MGRWENLFGRLGNMVVRAVSRQKYTQGFALRSTGEVLAGQTARAALRLLKDNCVQLPWIAEGAAIDAAVDGARADLLRSWNVYRASLSSKPRSTKAEADWQVVLTSFRRHVSDLNRRIATCNLKVPTGRFRRPPVDAEREIDRITSQ